MKRVKVKGHKRSKVKVTINVKEKAGGLRPTSSCFTYISRSKVKVKEVGKSVFLSHFSPLGAAWVT